MQKSIGTAAPTTISPTKVRNPISMRGSSNPWQGTARSKEGTDDGGGGLEPMVAACNNNNNNKTKPTKSQQGWHGFTSKHNGQEGSGRKEACDQRKRIIESNSEVQFIQDAFPSLSPSSRTQPRTSMTMMPSEQKTNITSFLVEMFEFLDIVTIQNALNKANCDVDKAVEILCEIIEEEQEKFLQLSSKASLNPKAKTFEPKSTTGSSTSRSSSTSPSSKSRQKQQQHHHHQHEWDAPVIDPAAAAAALATTTTTTSSDSVAENDTLYITERKEAIVASRRKIGAFKAAAAAFSRGEHTQAHEHVKQGRVFGLQATDLHQQAAQRIFENRNAENSVFEMDLHGLHANEACSLVGERLRWLRENESLVNAHGRRELSVIVGSGNHSQLGRQVLMPNVQKYLEDNNVGYTVQRKSTLLIKLI